MIALLDLSVLVTHIQASCPEFNGRVFQTIPDDDLSIDSHESPCCFVYINAESAGGQRLLGMPAYQRMTAEIAIDIVLRRTAGANDRFNNDVSTTLRNSRESVLNAVLGVGSFGSPLLHMKGILLQKKSKTVHFQDIFLTEYDIRSTA